MKNKQKPQNKLSEQEIEQLSNKTVLLTSLAILHAMLLLFFKKMTHTPETVIGALEFMGYLKWGSLVAAMGCAAWSAYKEKKGYYLYSAICLFVFLSLYTILDMGQADHAYSVNFIALAIVVVLSQAYYALRANNKFTGWFKILFLIVTFSSALFLVVVTLEPNVFKFF